jgi:arylsulfatase A-like enzyme
VVYTSDHGHLFGDHGLMGKFCLFEPAVRVPLILSHPPQLPQGASTPALTELLGLYPTVSELAGLPAPCRTRIVESLHTPERVEATSFASLARNPTLPGPAAVYSEYHLHGPVCSYMMRTHRYKYIHNQGGVDELYDEEADPGEYTNLVHDPRFRVEHEQLRQALFAWFDPAQNRHVARPSAALAARERGGRSP